MRKLVITQNITVDGIEATALVSVAREHIRDISGSAIGAEDRWCDGAACAGEKHVIFRHAQTGGSHSRRAIGHVDRAQPPCLNQLAHST